MDPKITILGAVTLILSFIPAVAIQLESGYTGALAGFAALAYLGASKLLDRKILETSTGRKTKAFQDIIETLSVFFLIGSAGLTQIIPEWLAIITVGLLGATEIFRLKMNRRYRKSFRLVVGQEYWILVTALIYLGSQANIYFLFYGLIVLCLILGYDLGSLARRIKR